jgi:hypothetical protein
VIASITHNRAATRAIWKGLVAFLSLCIPIFGQFARDDTKSQDGRGDPTLIVCSYRLVMVELEVQDGYHWPVSNLTRFDFVVFEDGKEQEIAFFQQKNVPNTETSQGQYKIGYYPPSHDGEFKKVRVRFRDAKAAKDRGLRLTHDLKGYYASFRD